MPTEKLYFQDSHLASFHGRVLRVAQFHESPSLVLDRTVFYPEGGGQLGDRGTLSISGTPIAVVDVQIDDAGDIHHLIGELPSSDVVGAVASGEIDAKRRRDFMSQHTAQHMLSCTLLEIARAETVSSRLGSEVSTIDIDVANLREELALRAEDRVNDVVLEDRPVRTLFPTEGELGKLPLRRPPKVEDGVRIVQVEGFDLSPCGGTHCTRTGEVGMVRVVGLERYKGGTRVTFVAGRRALEDYRRKDRLLLDLARSFSCGVEGVPTAVAKLRSDLKSRTEAFASARGELMAMLGERLLAGHPADPSGTTRIVIERDGDDVGTMRALASALSRRADVVALVASRAAEGEGWLVVIERGESASFDAGAWLKARTATHGGRGGGRADRAEGKLPATVSWKSVASET